MSSRSRTPGQLSLFELAQLDAPRASDDAIVRQLSEALLDEAGLAPPIDVRVLASLRGIAEIEIADQPWAGLLRSEAGRLVVRLRGEDGHLRQRFTVLHEAVHTYLPGFAEAPQHRCDPNGKRDRKEELCDLGASELLLPRRHFEPDLANLGFDMDAVAELADRYQASLEATAIRAVDLTAGSALFLVLRVGHKPADARNPDAEPRLRHVYGHGRGPWPFVPRYKSVSVESPFGRALDGELIEGRFSLNELVAGPDVPVRLSARAFGAERVLALIQPAA
jgi:hypothetical protein